MSERPAPVKDEEIGERKVLQYLRAHPEFLSRHPELLESLVPPQRELGEAVVDFQHFQVKNLQKNTRSLQEKYEALVDFCRDNLSVQAQVHNAVLKLVEVRSLEQLLEVLTLDFLGLFDLDVVRLGIESEAAELYDTYYSEENVSGIVFIEPGGVEAALEGKAARLSANAQEEDIPAFGQIFADCEEMIQSCALLKLEMQEAPKAALLALGVRYADRFHPKQASDLLIFLAGVVAHQLDSYLKDLDEGAP
jgi:hypothetical protein